MKRRIAFAIAVIILVLAVLVSCSQKQDSDIASAEVTIGSKALSAQAPAVSSWVYKAEPQFTLTGNAVPTGKKASWTAVSLSGGSAALGDYTSGRWLFSFRALDQGSNPVYTGSASVSLQPGRTNAFSVQMTLNSDSSLGAGSLRMGFETDSGLTLSVSLLTSAGGMPAAQTVSWDTSQTTHPSWYGDTAQVPAGRTFHSGTISGIAPGSWAVLVRIMSGSTVKGSQLVSFVSVSGSTSTVRGDLMQGLFSDLGFMGTLPSGAISGRIAASSALAEVNRPVTFTWVPDEGSAVPNRWVWSTGTGTAVATDSGTFTFVPPEEGSYLISVSPAGPGTVSSGYAYLSLTVLGVSTYSFTDLALRSGVMGAIPADKVLTGFADSGAEISYPFVASAPRAAALVPIYAGLSSVLAVSGGQVTGFAGSPVNLALPSSVTGIGGNAFKDCASLSAMVLPSSVTSIGDYAFSGCAGLTSITIPSGVTSIGKFAFCGCAGLTSITMPDSVTSISDWAFLGCSCLTSVSIPSGVTSIGVYAFSGCAGLESITIPSSVSSIGARAFYGCTGLASVTIPDSVTCIGSGTFASCISLKSITIPSGVTVISDRAFENCTGLTSVTIPSSVTSIGGWAFACCAKLTSVTFGSALSRIGAKAFSGCSGLTAVDFLAKGTGFKTMTIGDSSYDVWTGCPIRTVKIAQGNFGSQLRDEYAANADGTMYSRAPFKVMIYISIQPGGFNTAKYYYTVTSGSPSSWAAVDSGDIGAGGWGSWPSRTLTYANSSLGGKLLKWVTSRKYSSSGCRHTVNIYGLGAMTAEEFSSQVADNYNFTPNGRIGGDWIHSGSDSDIPFTNLDCTATCEECVYPSRIDYLLPI